MESREGRVRVLILAGWYPHAENPTAGVFVREQAQALQGECDVCVLYVHLGGGNRNPHVGDEDGLHVVRIDCPLGRSRWRRLRDLQNLAALTLGYRRAVRRGFEAALASWGRPDLIHAHVTYPGGYGACVLANRYGLPYLITEHSSEFLREDGSFWRRGRVIRWLMRRATERASRVVVVSRYLGRAMSECGLGGHYVVVPNVVRSCGPRPNPSDSVKTIACIALLSDYSKNLSLLLDATRLLRDRRDDFQLAIAGDGADRDSLEARRSALRLDDCVQFLGRLNDRGVEDLLARSTFSVSASRFETFSVSLAESLMCGRPVVATRSGGPEEFVTEEVGLLAEQGSVDQLSQLMDQMLENAGQYNPAALHAYAKERFSGERVAARINAVYESVLAEAQR